MFFVQISLNAVMEKFRTVETIFPSQEKVLSPQERLVEQNFLSTTQILEDGHFQVNLPLKTVNENRRQGRSFYLAEKRYLALEKRFMQKSHLFHQYKQFTDEYISLGHAKIVPLFLTNVSDANKYFLPHHCVIRNYHVSTKLRVIFNANMRTSSGVSLNVNKIYSSTRTV